MGEKNKWEVSTEKKPEKEGDFLNNNDTQENQELNVPEIITGNLSKNVVLFVGPTESGKTVALIRLAHYLRKQKNCIIEPNRTYRKDTEYQDVMNLFQNDLNQANYNPQATRSINFIVLDVFKNSELYCQFLEAPGEAYFDPDNPHDKSFPPYITDIMNNSAINKTFVFFYEDGMLHREDPLAYSKKISSLISMMNRKKDDVILLFNKCDKHRNLYYRNRPNIKEFKNIFYNNPDYSEFFGALKSFGIPVKFLVFSSGDFQPVPGNDDNKERWVHSDNHYPDILWRNIEKSFRKYTLF